jgi:phosphoglycolate phosphatase
MIKAIIFDFDGTLMHTCGLGHKILKHILKKKNIQFNKSEWEQLKIIFPLSAESLFIEWDKEYTIKFPKKVIPYKGVLEILSLLNNKEIKLFIFSTKYSRHINKALSKFSVTSYFSEIIGKDYSGLTKPNPYAIQMLKKKYSLKNKEILLVGDSKLDLESANKAKVKFIQIIHNQNKEKLINKNQIIYSMKDLVKFL